MRYPLQEIGATRQDCQRIIKHLGHPVPFPSSCKFCMFMTRRELYRMWLKDRDAYDRLKTHEAIKMSRFEKQQAKAGKPNHGVFRSGTLEENLEKEKAEFGHLSIKELDEITLKEGHKVCSSW